MQYTIKIEAKAEKQLARIPKKNRQRIQLVLIQLRSNPFIGKKLEGEYKNTYSLKVWPYRIIYLIYKSELIINVIRIGNRTRNL